ncbi:hypothetical protein AAMO2058_000465100 [Amorphochlora amoebiformis]
MAAVDPPTTVRELLAIGGLEADYPGTLEAKGYEDLEFLLTATEKEFKRLAKDTSMSSEHLGNLQKAVTQACAQVAAKSSTVTEYCHKLRAAAEATRSKEDKKAQSDERGARANVPVVASRALVLVAKPEEKTETSDMEAQFDRLMLRSHDTSISTKDEEVFAESNSGSTYGYMRWEGVTQMLESYETKDKVFYDLGSGVGRPVFAAAMQYPDLKKCVGVELSRRRHEQAIGLLSLMDKGQPKSIISFRCENMLKVDLSDADIVYISSLCFPKEFLTRLGSYLDEVLKEGAIVLSSKECPMSRAKLERRPVVSMSWNTQHQLHGYVMEGDRDP